VTAGSGTNWSSAVDAATNRLGGQTYDANGNVQFNGTGYDVENKMVSRTLAETSKNMTYQCDPAGHRVSAWASDGVTWANDQVSLTFYDITGKSVAGAGCGYTAGAMQCSVNVSNVYFGGRAISLDGQTVYTDRLGTVRWSANAGQHSYLPYGEERTSTADGAHKFGTYVRDSTLDGQDYAEARYYNAGPGRFSSVDPAGVRASSLGNPLTWNRYSYGNGDPANHNDRNGLLANQEDLDPQLTAEDCINDIQFCTGTREDCPRGSVRQQFSGQGPWIFVEG